MEPDETTLAEATPETATPAAPTEGAEVAETAPPEAPAKVVMVELGELAVSFDRSGNRYGITHPSRPGVIVFVSMAEVRQHHLGILRTSHEAGRQAKIARGEGDIGEAPNVAPDSIPDLVLFAYAQELGHRKFYGDEGDEAEAALRAAEAAVAEAAARPVEVARSEPEPEVVPPEPVIPTEEERAAALAAGTTVADSGESVGAMDVGPVGKVEAEPEVPVADSAPVAEAPATTDQPSS